MTPLESTGPLATIAAPAAPPPIKSTDAAPATSTARFVMYIAVPSRPGTCVRSVHIGAPAPAVSSVCGVGQALREANAQISGRPPDAGRRGAAPWWSGHPTAVFMIRKALCPIRLPVLARRSWRRRRSQTLLRHGGVSEYIVEQALEMPAATPQTM